MFRNAIKRIVILNCVFILVAIFSFFGAVVDLHNRYLDQKELIEILDSKIDRLCDEHNRSLEGLMGYERLDYKSKALSCHLPMFDQILETVYRIAPKYGFNPELVLKIIQVESAFKPKALSSMGAFGLMQVNLSVWQKVLDIDKKRIFDIEYNIDLGLRILKHYFDSTKGNIKLALHHYNNGYLYDNRAYVKNFSDQLLDNYLPVESSFFQAQNP